jgi:2,4-diaminopentanoate dehydrogenase
MTYRVIQWATGSIGRTCLRAVLDSPDCELAGLYVYNPDKLGRDAGDLARRAVTGIRATNDLEAILALDADVVIHTARLQIPYGRHDHDIARLLRSGKNVITTAGHHYPAPDRAAMFTAACAEGGSTLFGVGVSPGFIGERLALTLASACLDLDTITIDEVFDASGMVSPDFVFTVMGMGSEPAAVLAGPLPDLYQSLYSETLRFMADRLGFADYTLEPDHHVEVAPHDLEIRAGQIRKGTVAATEWRWHVVVEGRRRLTLAIIWTMDPGLPRYTGRPHWRIHLTGRPELTVSVDLHDPTDVKTTAGQYLVAGIVMRAIPVVVNATPGILEPVVFAPYRVLG